MGEVIPMGMSEEKRKEYEQHQEDLCEIIRDATDRCMNENDEESLRFLKDVTRLVLWYVKD